MKVVLTRATLPLLVSLTIRYPKVWNPLVSGTVEPILLTVLLTRKLPRLMMVIRPLSVRPLVNTVVLYIRFLLYLLLFNSAQMWQSLF